MEIKINNHAQQAKAKTRRCNTGLRRGRRQLLKFIRNLIFKENYLAIIMDDRFLGRLLLKLIDVTVANFSPGAYMTMPCNATLAR